MEDLDKIAEEIIMKGFPELDGLEIKTGYRKFKDYTLFQYGIITNEVHNGQFNYVYVNLKLKKAPKIVKVGGFAHEFAHMVIDKNDTKKEDNLYRYNKKFKMIEERNADVEAILRGYSKGIFALREYVRDVLKYPISETESGLSIIELKKLLMKN